MFSLITPAQARASAQPIGLTEVLALFYQRNLDLIAAHYEIDQARAQEVIAAAVPNPVFGVSLSELDATRYGGNNGAGPATGIGVSQLLETAGKRRLRMASSALGTASAEEDLRDATRTLSAAVLHAYYALLLAQKNTEVAVEGVTRYARLVTANELRLRHGDVAQADVLRLKVEAFKARANLLTVQAAQEQARTQIASLLRWPPGAMEFEARDDWPQPIANDDREALYTLAVTQRPDLRAARKRGAQAEVDLRLAKRTAVPDVTVGVGFSHDPNNVNPNTANLNVSVPLPLFYRNEGEIQKAAVAVSGAELQVQQLEQSIRAEVITGHASWRSADTIARGFEGEVLDQVRQIRDGAELSYLKGASSILDLLDAQRDYKDVMLQYQSALYDRAIGEVDLKTITGTGIQP